MTAPAVGAVELLSPLRAAGVLSASDLHVAAALARLTGTDEPDVILAAALAARAPRVGHVCIDLRTIADLVMSAIAEERGEADDPTATSSTATFAGAWPEPDAWIAAVAASPLVAGDAAPLVLVGPLLYLDRYYCYEQSVAEHLRRRAATAVPNIPVDPRIGEALLRGDGADQQRAVVDAAVRSALTVLVGGPGTGKTTTVAALLATLLDADPTLRVALAAPTGKAAARLGDAFGQAVARLPDELSAGLAATDAVTVHRLLGQRARRSAVPSRPRSLVASRRRDRRRDVDGVTAPHGEVARARRPDARLVLVGDPGQLVSVEAGSVLADLVAPLDDTPSLSALAGCIWELRHSRRFPEGSSLDLLARAVRAGDAREALDVLGAAPGDPPEQLEPVGGSLQWVPLPADDGVAIEAIRSLVMPGALDVRELARSGNAPGALAALERTRLLCAHRQGPFGVERWNARVEGWLRRDGVNTVGWYPGRPVLVTANNYRTNLYNGDLGVVVTGSERPEVVFAAAGAGDGVRRVHTAQLESYETVHAMTVHKSQGSEFDHIVVVLPPAGSRLATRELLYTAITRAWGRVTLVGDELAVAAAVGRRVERASGLRAELWPVG